MGGVMGFDDFDINVSSGNLTISSAVEESDVDSNNSYTTHEYSYTTFSRSWSLPENVNAANISARYDAGILNVSVPLETERDEDISVSVE